MKETTSKLHYNPIGYYVQINPQCGLNNCTYYPDEPYFNPKEIKLQTTNTQQFITCISCCQFKGVNNFIEKEI